MELSALYTRRLSGSSSRNSFDAEALEQLEFNINDISRASSPASVTSVSARSEGTCQSKLLIYYLVFFFMLNSSGFLLDCLFDVFIYVNKMS